MLGFISSLRCVCQHAGSCKPEHFAQTGIHALVVLYIWFKLVFLPSYIPLLLVAIRDTVTRAHTFPARRVEHRWS